MQQQRKGNTGMFAWAWRVDRQYLDIGDGLGNYVVQPEKMGATEVAQARASIARLYSLYE